MRQLDKSKMWQVLSCAMEAMGARRLALRYIQRAIAINPQKLELHIQASRLFLKEGQVDQAALHCKKADIGVGPGGFLYLLDKASNGGYLSTNDQPLAVDKPDTVDIDAEVSDIATKFNNSGLLLLGQHKYCEAIACFEQAIKCSRRDPVILINLALAYSKVKDYNKSLNMLEQAQQMGYSSLELLGLKGYALFHLHRHEEAVTCFELARQMAPEDSAILGNLGSCYQELGKYNEAVECYKIAIGVTPQVAILYNNMAICLEKLDNDLQAQEYYIKAVSMPDADSIVFTNYAACLGKLGRYAEAIEFCDKAIDNEPNNYEAWGLKGNILMEMGKTNEAAKAFAKALGLAS
ncbi:tetratricopeptide repeat protein [Peptococcaceae bacterium 1198_IL3148]